MVGSAIKMLTSMVAIMIIYGFRPEFGKVVNFNIQNFRDNAVADQFKVKAVPTVYLCDANGNIVAANEECRGEALAAKLKELLK